MPPSKIYESTFRCGTSVLHPVFVKINYFLDMETLTRSITNKTTNTKLPLSLDFTQYN